MTFTAINRIIIITLLLQFFLILIKSNADILTDFQQKKAKCITNENYETLTKEIYDFIEKQPTFEDVYHLRYLIAESRIDQLKKLKESNNLNSGRYYIRFKNQYIEEAKRELVLCSKSTMSPEFLANVYYLLLFINQQENQYEEENNNLESIINILGNTDPLQKKALVPNLLDRLCKDKINDAIEKIQIIYFKYLTDKKIYETDKEVYQIIEEQKVKSNNLFDDKKYEQAKLSDSFYLDLIEYFQPDKTIITIAHDISERYFEVKQYNYSSYFHKRLISRIQKYSPEQLENKIIEIADRYFDINERKLAAEFYQEVMKLKNKSYADYVQFKLIKCNIYSADKNKYDFEKTISECHKYLKEYPNSQYVNYINEDIQSYYALSGQFSSLIDFIKILKNKTKDTAMLSTLSYRCGVFYFLKSDLNSALHEFRYIKNYSNDTGLIANTNEYIKKIDKLGI